MTQADDTEAAMDEYRDACVQNGRYAGIDRVPSSAMVYTRNALRARIAEKDAEIARLATMQKPRSA